MADEDEKQQQQGKDSGINLKLPKGLSLNAVVVTLGILTGASGLYGGASAVSMKLDAIKESIADLKLSQSELKGKLSAFESARLDERTRVLEEDRKAQAVEIVNLKAQLLAIEELLRREGKK